VSDGTEPVRREVAFHGRLNAEARVLGFVSFASLTLLVQVASWTAVLVDQSLLASLRWSWVLVPPLCGVAIACGAVVVRFPVARWPRPEAFGHLPSPVPLLVLGPTALPWLWLVRLRHDRALAAPAPSPEDVELSFRQLLAIPRLAGNAVATWVGGSLLVEAGILLVVFDWPRTTMLPLVALWLCLLGPFVVVVVARVRAVLRPEYLSAPRARNVSAPSVTDLRVRLAVPALVAGLAGVAGPLLAGWLATPVHASTHATSAASSMAERAVEVAAGPDARALGRFLAEHPGVAVRRGTVVYGSWPRGLENAPEGMIDADGDGRPDHLAHRERSTLALVPLLPPPTMDKTLMLAAFLALALGGSAAVFLIARDVARDVARATAQVSAVANGEVPPPLTEGSFSTRELRQLVQSVDRLVTRITDTNVAKYVAIEKAQEADRLKSQFLANMSHDLRSPLNSIIGFSELLSTGIEGELHAEQKEMVDVIHSSGRELLQQIDDILDTAKIEAGRMELHPEPTPPATLISRAVQNARKRQPKPIEYDTVIAPGLSPAFVDPYRTVQAIENVLVFAAELVDDGTIMIRARPGSAGEAPMIFVRVETPRAPATARHLSAVLRGFYRIPGHRGLGLGLPIAGSIVELQGGALDIEELGEGMSFTVQLPIPEARVKMRLRKQ
jgi:signal transduction histidine kinase